MSERTLETAFTIAILAVVAGVTIYVATNLVGFLIRNWWVPLIVTVAAFVALYLLSTPNKTQ